MGLIKCKIIGDPCRDDEGVTDPEFLINKALQDWQEKPENKFCHIINVQLVTKEGEDDSLLIFYEDRTPVSEAE
jgi:hypothetical protein